MLRRGENGDTPLPKEERCFVYELTPDELLAYFDVLTVEAANDDSLVNHTIERENLWRALTPQMFSLGLLQDALWSAKTENAPVTDEAAAMERMGHVVQLVSGLSTNVKVTLPYSVFQCYGEYNQSRCDMLVALAQAFIRNRV